MKVQKIAVLLTCFNRVEKTVRCLENLQQSSPNYADLDVFLVDDGSTDGTGDTVRNQFPNVQVIQGTGSLYWNRGMHLAWETAAQHSNFDYYLLLNDDTFLFPNAIEELLSCVTETNDKAIVCGAFCGEHSLAFTYGGRDKDGNPVVPNGAVQTSSSINGNCLLVSKTIFDAVGNLDPIFPHAIGDYDYGQRALSKGFGLVTTKCFLGTCESNTILPKWCVAHEPIKERINSLYSPLGNSHPKYYFIYVRRHFGWFLAIRHFCSIHLRLLIPSLWK